MTLKIERELYSDAFAAEIQPLLEAQWREIAGYQQEIPLDPDFDYYKKMDAQGKLVCLTARLNGALIGYSVFVLIRHPHYQSTIFAMNDVIFVHPEHRKGRVGLWLIRESERLLKTLGARKITWHIKLVNDFNRILTALGYGTEEIIMGKLL